MTHDHISSQRGKLELTWIPKGGGGQTKGTR
jgi:hypothetical protein